MLVINRIKQNSIGFLKDIWNLATSLFFWLGLALFLCFDSLDRTCSILIGLTTSSKHLLPQIIFGLIAIGGYALMIVLAYRFYRFIEKRHHIHSTTFSLKRILKVIKNHFGSLILWFVVAIIIEDTLSTITYNISNSASGSENQDALNKVFGASLVSAITLGIIAIFFAPILEELLNRGIFYNLFDFSHLNIVTKILVVTLDGIIFASGHMTANFAQFLPYFAMGIVFSLCYLSNHSLTCSATLHLSFNAFSIFM